MKLFGFDITRDNNKKQGHQPLLKESVVTNKTLGLPTGFDRSDINNFPIDDYTFDFLNTESFNDLWSISNDRKALFQSYDDMSRDPIIAAALEMYADDATQYDPNGKVIWVESSNPDLAKTLNNRLSVLGIDGKAWTIYYMLAKFGEVYIRQFKYRTQVADERNQISGGVVEYVQYEDYIEVVKTPEDYYDLVRKGKTEQFARIVDESTSRSINSVARKVELYPPDQFIHIALEKPDTRTNRTQTLELEIKNPDGTSEIKEYDYDLREGKSMLQDIYGVQRQITLLENSLILNRLSKSAITRIVSVEVGDMAAPQVSNTLRRVKSALENKVAFDTSTGMTNYNSASGMDNIVVSPTRDGKGAITTDVIGGDVDVKSLLDLDYFNNKRFGGLKIPKAFLGYEEALGNNGGGTLTKQDIRYGRTIKRLQTAVVSGITTMLTLWLKSKGYSNEEMTNFTVKVTSPTTEEDEESSTRIKDQFEVANSIMDLVGDTADRKEVLSYLFNNVLDHPELSTLLASVPDENPTDEESPIEPEEDDLDLDTTNKESDDLGSGTEDEFLSNPDKNTGLIEPDEDELESDVVPGSTKLRSTTVTVPSQSPSIK